MLKVSGNKKLHVVLALYQIKNEKNHLYKKKKKLSFKSIEVKTLYFYRLCC